MLTQEERKSHPSTSTSFTSVKGTKSYVFFYMYCLYIYLSQITNIVSHYSKLLVQQRILDEAKAYPSKCKKKRWGK